MRKRRGRRLLGFLLAVPVFLIFLSLAVTLPFRWLDPPTSAFMLAYRMSVGATGEERPSLHYEWVEYEAISPDVAIAVVAAEDQKFPIHRGFDVESIRRALEENKSRELPRGASTITQQVVKNLYLWPGRSLLRKGLEAYLTVLTEWLWPKRRIFEVYLNVAEFGTGIYGVGAASRIFFGKPASQLDLVEASLLAAVLPNPTLMHADRPSEYVRKRAGEIRAQVGLLGGAAYLGRL